MASEKCLDAQLWHACAGGMARIPAVNSTVFYFPEGHAEHAGGGVEFGGEVRIPALIRCRVSSIKFMADHDTDEVFAKMGLVPIGTEQVSFDPECGRITGDELGEKPVSFAKTLTQSDANNGGGFSVPRYCAETIFPKLDYSADPPVQTVLVRDVHGEIWKFRHIYRGTPRRHLLTTGWSNFVNRKKLVAGDSVVFLRANNGDLCVGIRRAKRGVYSSWSCIAPMRGYGVSAMRMKGRVSAASVVEAVTRAAREEPFEVAYYPRAGTPEFCVGESTVVDAMQIRWGAGMRFKMAFETEDSSRISWFMGTVAAVRVADPARWPNSPWRILQVTWDEPELLQSVRGVNPWLVELVTDAFLPPLKKLCIANERISVPAFSSGDRPEQAPAGIQGARHARYDVPLIDLHCDKMQLSLFPAGARNRPPATTEITVSTSTKAPFFMLFGQRILTEKQLSAGSSADTVSTPANSSSEANTEKSSSSSDGLGDDNSSIFDSRIFGIEQTHIVACSRSYADQR